MIILSYLYIQPEEKIREEICRYLQQIENEDDNGDIIGNKNLF